MARKILITGASGLIGSHLTEHLVQKGYRVFHLSRRSANQGNMTFTWNVKKGFLEEHALRDIDTIIHLAGAGIADKRWTKARKREILESRTMSTRLLFEALSTRKHNVSTFITSSAIGYYGFGDDAKLLKEDDPPGTDFLATVTSAWESEADAIARLGIRVVKLRTGLVFSDRGGVLKKMALPVKLGVGAAIASGKQTISWIHVSDLCRIYELAITNTELSGAFNAVSPNPVTNKQLNREMAKVLRRPIWLPNVPGFAMKLFFGELAVQLINGSRVSSKKITDAGFQFEFAGLQETLEDLLI